MVPKNLVKAVRFFLVADSNGGQRNLEFKNNCNEPVWVASQGSPLPFRGGFKLDAYQSLVKQVPGNTVAARFWGRTGTDTYVF